MSFFFIRIRKMWMQACCSYIIYVLIAYWRFASQTTRLIFYKHFFSIHVSNVLTTFLNENKTFTIVGIFVFLKYNRLINVLMLINLNA